MLETKKAKLMVAVVVTLLLAAFQMALQASPAYAADPTLTVTKTGSGTVTSDPPGINCGTDCSEPYPVFEEEVCNQHGACNTIITPQSVTLSASAASGWAFGNWSNACSGTSPSCTVQMNTDKTVQANFVDAQNPSVSLTSPTGPYASGIITLAASASDNDQVARVEFRVNGSLVATDLTAPYSASYNTTSTSDGLKEFRATAFDASGRSAFHTRSVTVDNTDPFLEITSGPNGQTFAGGSTQTWNFNFSDGTGSGIQSVQCSVVGAGSTPSYGPCSGGNSHSVMGRPEGSHTFYVRARDASGRESVRTRDFSIDATGPGGTVSINGGAELTNSTSVTLTPSATDPSPGSGVASMRFSNDGVSWSDWEPYATSKSWSLASGDGTKTVRAQYRDGVNNVSTTAQDTIKLDATAPTVKTWNPKKTNVKPTAKPTVTFSEKMDVATLVTNPTDPANPNAGASSTFVLKKGTKVIPASVSYTENGTTFKAVLKPNKKLKAGAKYTATVTSGAKDAADNALVAKSWKFTVKR